jgi:hypothetical protein
MSLSRLAGTVGRLSTPGTLTATRRAAGTTDGRGRAVEGATSTFPLQGSVQPVTGRDLLRLPEGLRTRELVAIISATELHTANAAAGTVADVVAYQGASYEVQSVEDWSLLGGYWRVVAAKEGA